MIVSTRGRYALRVMIDIAENSTGRPIAMKEVAERQELPLKYLERILPVLVCQNMLEAFHGKGGGYRLMRDPSEYSVGEILRLTEGDLAPVSCAEFQSGFCERNADCRTLPVWKELNRRINDYLDSVTLKDLMRKEP